MHACMQVKTQYVTISEITILETIKCQFLNSFIYSVNENESKQQCPDDYTTPIKTKVKRLLSRNKKL